MLLRIAFEHRHVEHGREPSAVAGRTGAFDEVGRPHHVRVERGEESEQVGRVVDGRAVEEDEVLVWGAAADEEAGRSLAASLHAGHELDGFDEVRLSSNRGDAQNLFRRHLDVRPPASSALGRDLDTPQADRFGLEFDDDEGVGEGRKPDHSRAVAEVGCLHDRRAALEREHEAPVPVGGRPSRLTTFPEGGADEALPRLRIRDASGQDPGRGRTLWLHRPDAALRLGISRQGQAD